MNVARKIGLFLRHAGISQAEMSQRTGISASKLRLLLEGKRRLTFGVYESICQALGVGVETFLEPRAPDGTQS
ncbi:MAG: helix-turn-helix transcriptional regulator [Butyricicoccus pullicaecorum]|nr:helix-turn-helix transcriptional regulator [Butyricicoccus pullicaecorum]